MFGDAAFAMVLLIGATSPAMAAMAPMAIRRAITGGLANRFMSTRPLVCSHKALAFPGQR